MKLSRQLLLAWMILWLPVAGVIAAVMPITGMSGIAGTSDRVTPLDVSGFTKTISDGFSGPTFGANGLTKVSDTTSANEIDLLLMPCHGNAVGKKLPAGKPCTHCVLCHLAGALAMQAMPVMPSVSPTNVFALTPPPLYPSYIPDLLAPPPRTALAYRRGFLPD